MAAFLFKWFMMAGFFTGNPVIDRHPIYMSVTDIEHNANEKTLEISCKIFTLDFESTLRAIYKTKVDLINPKNKAAMNALVSDYVKKHLFLKIEGKAVDLQFIGYEQVDEGINSFYQVKNIEAVKNMDITDNILYDYYKEQIGILHITVNGRRKSTKLVYPEDKVSMVF